jgi:hypothetical protein
VCDDFHDASWAARLAIANRFTDPRLRALAIRLIYSEHRSILPADDQYKADRALADRLLDDRGGPLTLPGALDGTDQLISGADPASSALLSGYRAYLTDRIARATAYRVAM